ncbi:unnamed protein product [Caenorhabditis auriculariae]|uniref:non-specific protein-tyrosine kinase n=1 Tax=Caenorhabditis auriculariae TaxID=2777116 RepID=A0A8S1HKI1_9PELO|nr:unnamed protein product [Caenorhabditis auriculariae]
MANYFRRFIRGFAAIAAPLTELTKKDTLKQKLVTCPVLQGPAIDQPFILESDASGIAVGAVLLQRKSPEEPPHVIAYASRKLNKAERIYPPIESEALALVFAVTQFRTYILGLKTTAIVDHKPLTTLLRRRDLIGRLAKYQLVLSEYNLEIVYHETKEPKPLPMKPKPKPKPAKETSVAAVEVENLAPQVEIDLDEIRVAQERSEYCREAVKILQKERRRRRQESQKHPEALQPREWSSLRATTFRNFCGSSPCSDKNCGSRNHCKDPEKSSPQKKLPVTSSPFERCHIDVLGPLPITINENRYVLTIVDAFSKWIIAVPLPKQDSAAINRAFTENLVLKHGPPSMIISDNGTQFVSNSFKNLLKKWKIQHQTTAPYHKTSNGQVERVHRTLEEALASFVNNFQSDWDSYLQAVVFALNTLPGASTKLAPFHVLFGREPRLPEDSTWNTNVGLSFIDKEDYVEYLQLQLKEAWSFVKEKLQETAEKHAKRFDNANRTAPRKIVAGSTILVKRALPKNKLSPFLFGPFTVVKVNGSNVEYLDYGKTFVAHKNDVRQLKSKPPTPEEIIDEDVEEEEEEEEEPEKEKYIRRSRKPTEHSFTVVVAAVFNHESSRQKKPPIRKTRSSTAKRQSPNFFPLLPRRRRPYLQRTAPPVRHSSRLAVRPAVANRRQPAALQPVRLHAEQQLSHQLQSREPAEEQPRRRRRGRLLVMPDVIVGKTLRRVRIQPPSMKTAFEEPPRRMTILAARSGAVFVHRDLDDYKRIRGGSESTTAPISLPIPMETHELLVPVPLPVVDTNKPEGFLKEWPGYHGYLPDLDARKMIRHIGDYIIRLENDEQNTLIILNVGEELVEDSFWEIDPKSEDDEATSEEDEEVPVVVRTYVIENTELGYSIDVEHCFETVESLLSYYVFHPDKSVLDVKLLHAVPLRVFEIESDDIQENERPRQRPIRRETAAVKSVKPGLPNASELSQKLIDEGRIMLGLEHPNIVRMYGWCLDEQPLKLVLQFVAGGSLDIYLINHYSVTSTKRLIKFGVDIAQGLEYLHSKNIIHRDIAARNILLTSDGTPKISDFGLSIKGSFHRMKVAEKLPSRHLPPEVLNQFTFSRKSDVYSFGVLLYEVFAGGRIPYAGLLSSEVKACILSGIYNIFPSRTPQKLVEYVEENLWAYDFSRRPLFDEIVDYLEALEKEIEKDGEHGYVTEGEMDEVLINYHPDIRKESRQRRLLKLRKEDRLEEFCPTQEETFLSTFIFLFDPRGCLGRALQQCNAEPLSATGCCGYQQDPWRNLPPQPHFSFIHLAKLDSSVTAESVGAGTPYSRPELPTHNIAVLILAAARLMSVLPFSGRLSADAYGKDLAGKNVG